MAEKSVKKKLKDLELKDLLRYEQAARLVCMKYENSLRRYDNTMEDSHPEHSVFAQYNNLHTDILLEMEARLKELL